MPMKKISLYCWHKKKIPEKILKVFYFYTDGQEFLQYQQIEL
jgi:hypothetical protein